MLSFELSAADDFTVSAHLHGGTSFGISCEGGSDDVSCQLVDIPTDYFGGVTVEVRSTHYDCPASVSMTDIAVRARDWPSPGSKYLFYAPDVTVNIPTGWSTCVED